MGNNRRSMMAVYKEKFNRAKTTEEQNRIIHKFHIRQDLRFKPVHTPAIPGLVNHWVRHSECRESWNATYIISARTKDQARKILSRLIDPDGCRINSPYDCTGRPFSSSAYIRKVGPNLFLATQYGGLDV